MTTGKVIILKDMGEEGSDLDLATMNRMADDLKATIIHLPMRYDLERVGLGTLKALKQTIEKEIKRKELLAKLDRSK